MASASSIKLAAGQDILKAGSDASFGAASMSITLADSLINSNTNPKTDAELAFDRGQAAIALLDVTHTLVSLVNDIPGGKYILGGSVGINLAKATFELNEFGEVSNGTLLALVSDAGSILLTNGLRKRGRSPLMGILAYLSLFQLPK